MSGRNCRILHSVCLLLALGLCICFLLGLKELDNYISMPLLKPKQTIDQSTQEAMRIDELINSIDFPVTLEMNEQISSIRAEYELLDTDTKIKVKSLNLLEEAEKQINDLKDKEAAKKVTDMINALTDNYDLYSLEMIRKVYDELTEQQKKLVTNLFILENAEEEIKTIVTKDNLFIGDIVIFNGGNIYYSSKSSYIANNKGYSRCKVTNVSRDSTHPYHLVSVDGQGVYGWVDINDISRE